jgi:xanthine dehydrogenase molybdopterin-binding subunit B
LPSIRRKPAGAGRRRGAHGGGCTGERKIGHLKRDYDVIIPAGEVTHFCGDAVALVAAETREALAEAKAKVRVEYEELEAVLDLHSAMEGRTAVHAEMGMADNLFFEQKLIRGDAEARIADRNTWSRENTGHRPRSTPFWSRRAPWRCQRATAS